MEKLKILALCLLLSGCSAGNRLEYSKEALQKSDITFIGIPTVFGLGIQGTTFPISPHYSLTAIHVANKTLNKVQSYHPICDVALIKHDNTSRPIPKFNHSNIGDKVNTYGYSFIFAMPNKSEGVVKARLSLDESYNKKGCLLLASDSGVRIGMSGGPVYDDKNDVVGVISAYITNIKSYKDNKERNVSYSVFVPVQSFQYWLVEELNKTEDKGILKIENNQLISQ